jgi:hypothetical protein
MNIRLTTTRLTIVYPKDFGKIIVTETRLEAFSADENAQYKFPYYMCS